MTATRKGLGVVAELTFELSFEFRDSNENEYLMTATRLRPPNVEPGMNDCRELILEWRSRGRPSTFQGLGWSVVIKMCEEEKS